jgi:hypothetical protein
MTVVYRLYHNTSFVDLVGGAAKSTVDDYSAYPAGPYVVETFTLLVTAASRALVRTALNDVVEMLEKAKLYHATRLEQYPVYLRWYTDGEAAKQALVYDYALQPAARIGITPDLDVGDGLNALWSLAITRDREWESADDNPTSVASTEEVENAGVALDLTAITGGTANGRMTRLILGGGSEAFNKFWIGIHRLRLGQADEIAAVDLTDAYTSADTTIDAETGSVNGDRATVTFSAHPDWKARAYGVLPTGGATSYHWVGRWLVLARARQSGSTDVMIRVSVSANDLYLYGEQPTLLHQGPPAVVNRTEHHLYELGEIQLPPFGLGTSDDLSMIRLNLEARRISGPGQLYVDCFILIPAEHMVAVTGVVVEEEEQLYVDTDASGSVIAVVKGATGATVGIGAATVRNWRWPKEGGAVVAAFERSTGHVIADTVEVSISQRKRWLGYRE